MNACRFHRISLLAAMGAMRASILSLAQIVTDGSIGNTTTPTVISPSDGGHYDIDASYGKTAGPNLFHSFADFNVMQGETAVFSGPETTKNVIARVTGGKASEINGTLKSDIDNANLYLLNRAGIHFGSGASLAISGSFHATTADHLMSVDGMSFPSVKTANGTLFESEPASYGFLNSHLGEINLNGANLTAPPGKAITAAAGAISLNHAAIRAPAGTISLSAAQSESEIGVHSLPESNIGTRGPITLSSASVVTSTDDATVPENSSPRIDIAAGSLSLDTGSAIGILSDDATPSSPTVTISSESLELQGGSRIDTSSHDPGKIEISSSGSVNLNGSFIQAVNSGSAEGADIRLSSDTITMNPGSYISTESTASGDAGALGITSRSIEVDRQGSPRFTGLYSAAFGSGTAGNLSITSEDLKLSGGAVIDARTTGPGAAGLITLTASDLQIREFAKIDAGTTSSGPGGTVSLGTGKISLESGGKVQSESRGMGPAGSVIINASAVNLKEESVISTSTRGEGVGGPGGPIHIHANTLEINGSEIRSETFNQSPGGNILIDNQDGTIALSSGGRLSTKSSGLGSSGSIKVEDSQNLVMHGGPSGTLTGIITSTAFIDEVTSLEAFSTPAKAGDVDVNADTIELRRGAVIRTTASRAGSAGNIKIDGKSIMIDGERFSGNTGITAQSVFTGKAALAARNANLDEDAIRSSILPGMISIDADDLTVQNSGQIAVVTVGASLGGDIDIDLKGSLTLDNFGSIAASAATRDADAGSISIKGESLSLDNISWIAVETIAAEGSGSTGDIDIHTNTDISVGLGSHITAKSLAGDAGTIRIRSGGDLSLMRAEIVADAKKNGGNLSVSAQAIALRDSLLQADAIDKNGGKVTVTSQLLYKLGTSDISANSTFGLPGIVDLRVSEDFTRTLVPLPITVLEAANLVQEGCFTENPYGVSLFVRDKSGVGWTPSAYTFPIPLNSISF